MIIQYSIFGSTMTIGGMIGSLVNGKMTDLVGRRGVSCCNVFFNTEPAEECQM